MRDLGRRLAGMLRAGDIVILSGPLGAGKTTLTQGIGEGLGVRGPVTSPTFVIARVHPVLPSGAAPLVHVDAYRLGSALELDDLDLDADVDSAVTVVEWGEGLAEGLAQDRLEILITREAAPGAPDTAGEFAGELGLSDQPRTVRITGVGSRWQDMRMTRTDVVDRL
jgi:tRNA threonylcarbamoyladenosine biosynthesis protein TsaE